MLMNDIHYEIYYGGGGRGGGPSRRPFVKRQSWPATPGTVPAHTQRKLASARRAIGRALIGLGQLISSEPRSAAPARAGTTGR